MAISANPVVSIVSSGSATTACAGEIKTLTANLPAPSGTITVPFGTNLNSDGVAPAVFAGTLSGIPEGATITSAQLQFANVNAINGSWRSEIRVALNGVYTLGATQISTLGSPGLISPDPVVNLVGFPAASGAINLVITETFNDAGATVDATFGSAQLVVSYTLPSTVVTWSPTTDLYTDANATIPYTGGNATTVYAQMSTPVSYTVTSTNVLGCVREATASYTMTTVGCPSTTNVQTSLCGATLSTINQPIYANLVANAQGYRFRVTDLTTNEVQSIDRNLRVFQLTQLTDYAFDRSYRVEVSVRLGGVWQPYYGAACTVTTPSALTQVQAAQCGSTLTTINDVIYANNVPFATGYKFRITNLLTSAQEEIERPLRDIRITNITNPEFNTTYSVEVAVRNTDGAYLPYGSVCNITTPSFPTSQLQLSQCDVVITNPNAVIYADSYSGATTYRFRFVNTGLGYTYQFDKPLRSFELNTVPGLLPGETYSVQVSIEIGGEFGPFGKVCTLTTPGGARSTEPAVKSVEFQVTASPNPFADNFKLDVKTSTDESIQVVVYDMLGKQIEVRNVTVSSITDLEVGTNYPAGVYNVIVSQGGDVKTLRVIKR